MSEKSFNVAVAGATGAVGLVILEILEQRNFPVKEIRLLASERSVGKRLKFKGEEISVQKLDEDAFAGIDIALFSAGASRSREFAPHAVSAGAVVVDNSSAFRMDDHVPLVVPEINGDAIGIHRGIIANPNCTTIVAIMPVKPLHDFGRVKRIVVSSYQAVSGAGAKAMEELKSQVNDFVHGREMVSEIFPKQISFNLIPRIDAVQDNYYTREEMKMVNETRKIMGDDSIAITCTTVRVPVFRAHAISANVETEKKITREKAMELIDNFPGCRVMDDPANDVYPTPIFSSGRDDCYVGRIREDESIDNGLNYWVVGDQLRKGAALNAVQIAETLVSKFM
jgi:aspartate-semialdehyde dehydrogenase